MVKRNNSNIFKLTDAWNIKENKVWRKINVLEYFDEQHSYSKLPWSCTDWLKRSSIRGLLNQDGWHLPLPLKHHQLFLCWKVILLGLLKQHFYALEEPWRENDDNNELHFVDGPIFSNMFQQAGIQSNEEISPVRWNELNTTILLNFHWIILYPINLYL